MFQRLLSTPARPHSLHDPPRTLIILGTDGAGKTTVIQALVQSLNADGIPAQRTANVAGRRWLTRRMQTLGIEFPTYTQDLIESVIRSVNVLSSSLRASGFAGVSVMDRHLYCQLVLRRLRGQPLGLAMPWLARKSTARAQLVLLDIAPEVAFERIEERGQDHETLDYLRASRNEYLRLAGVHGWHVIDANRPVPHLVSELRNLLEPMSHPGVREPAALRTQ